MAGRCPKHLVDGFLEDWGAGLTNHQLADKYHVDPRTIRSWKHRLKEAGIFPKQSPPPPDDRQQQEGTTFAESGNYAEASAHLITTLDELLERCAVDLTVWRVLDWGVKQWSVGAKAEWKDLKWDAGKISGWVRSDGLVTAPLWSVWAKFIRKEPIAIQPALRPIVSAIQYTNPERPVGEAASRCLISADWQLGYKRVKGQLIPSHDRQALDLFLQAIQHYKPDVVVLLGDILDNAEWTDRFVRSPEYEQTTQPAACEAHWWLAQMRAAAPKARFEMHEGNHDRRIREFLSIHLRAAYGLRAGDGLEESALLTPETLMGTKSLGIEWVGNYPNDLTWLNDELQVYHGDRATAVPGATARAVVEEFDTSVIFGHAHRRESASRTIFQRAGRKEITAYGLGCMCRLDGTVPAVRDRVDWQQGFALVEYTKTEHAITPIEIHDGRSLWDGKTWQGQDRLEQLRQDIPDWMGTL